MRGVDQLRMNLVADHQKVEFCGERGDTLQFGTGVHPTGRIVRIDEHHHLRSVQPQFPLKRVEIHPPTDVGVDERHFRDSQTHGVQGG